jgi:hypothetical protein
MNDPAEGAFTITFSDTVEVTRVPRSIYVTTSGTLRVKMVSGDTVSFAGMVGGMVYPFRIRQVYQTGTTVAGVVGLY